MKNIIINKTIMENALATAVGYLPSKESDSEGMLTINANGVSFSIVTTNHAESVVLSELDYLSDELEKPCFSFSIDGKRMLHVARSIKAESLKLAITDKEVTISGGRNKVKLEISDVIFDFIINKQGDSLNIEKLFDGFRSILHAIDIHNPKFELSGILLECQNGVLSLVGTDTRRLSIFTIENVVSPCNIIISKESIKSILKLFEGQNAQAVSTSTDLTIWTESICYQTKLINGTYPQWQRIIPQKIAKIFSMDRQKLLELLKEASIFKPEVEIIIGNEMISIADLDGNAVTNDSVSTDGLSMQFNVNSKYIMDFLTSYDGEKIQIGMNDPKLPLVLIANPRYKEIVMPYCLEE